MNDTSDSGSDSGTTDLLPCPFCGGDAEMDTRQGYANYVTKRPETGIAIYCRQCGVQQMICRGDVPDIEPEAVIEMWNLRVSLTPAWLPVEAGDPELLERVARAIEVYCDDISDARWAARAAIREILSQPLPPPPSLTADAPSD